MGSDRYEDERGVIQDLITERLDAVTEIFTWKGGVRGNHVHNDTTQWGYVVSGTLKVVNRSPGGAAVTRVHAAGSLFCENPGVAHAWEALENTVVLVFTRGPRSGENYESDVQRLPEGDRLI